MGFGRPCRFIVRLGWLAVYAGFGAVLIAASGFAADQAGGAGAVLVYHRFGPAAGPTTVSDPVLDEQLAWLAGSGRVAPLRRLLDVPRTGATSLDRPCVAISVDDGHRSIYTDLYPRLLRYRLPVTLFIYPSAISNAPYALTWPELIEMVASGLVDVQSHTYWHPNFAKEKARRSPADYMAFVDTQLTRSKVALETRLGRKADMLAWPFGIHDQELEAAAVKAGYSAGFILGNRAFRPDTDRLALPRFWVSDSDRPTRLAARLAPACPGRWEMGR